MSWKDFTNNNNTTKHFYIYNVNKMDGWRMANWSSRWVVWLARKKPKKQKVKKWIKKSLSISAHRTCVSRRDRIICRYYYLFENTRRAEPNILSDSIILNAEWDKWTTKKKINKLCFFPSESTGGLRSKYAVLCTVFCSKSMGCCARVWRCAVSNILFLLSGTVVMQIDITVA